MLTDFFTMIQRKVMELQGSMLKKHDGSGTLLSLDRLTSMQLSPEATPAAQVMLVPRRESKVNFSRQVEVHRRGECTSPEGSVSEPETLRPYRHWQFQAWPKPSG